MTAEDSTVTRAPLGADVSWRVLCLPLRQESAALPWERPPGLGSAGDFMAQGRGYGSSWIAAARVSGSGRGGVAEDGCGAVPLAERQGKQAEGTL